MFAGNKSSRKGKSLIAIVSSDQAHEEIQFVTAKLPEVRSSIKKTDDTLRDGSKLVNGSADVVIIEADLANPESDKILKQLCQYVSQSGFLIVLAENATPASTRALFKAGVNDVLPLPLERSEFLSSLESAFGSLVNRQQNYQSRGKVITLVKCGGGVGATTLATNIAHTIMTGANAKKSRKDKNAAQMVPRVAVFDFDVQFGNVAVGLNVENTTDILDARRAEDRLDAALLDSAISVHKSGLSILPSPADIVPFTAFSSEFFEQIIGISRAMFDYVVIDMPQAWTSWTQAVLDKSDLIVPVLCASVENVHNSQKILSGLDLMKINRENTIVAINKVPKGITSKDRITQIKKITNRPVTLIHEDIRTNVTARDRGALLSEISAGSATVKDIYRITDQIIKQLISQQHSSAPNVSAIGDELNEQTTGL
jgi:pilus assembly protein CpaE